MPTVRQIGRKAALAVRFQGKEIHAGQRALLAHVLKRHRSSNTLIAIGFTGGVATDKDPLRRDMVEQMIRQTWPHRNYRIRFLKDNAIGPEFWSRDFDKLANEEFPGESPLLYGAADSFLKEYSGKHEKVVIPTKPGVRGTQLRQQAKLPQTKDARAALIFASQFRPPFAYSTTDLAIVNRKKRTVWLIGKRGHEGFLTFIGGHFQKGDGTGGRCALREQSEEVLGMRVGPPKIIENFEIDDPRYRGSKDTVMTGFYESEYLSGTPVVNPDEDADWTEEVTFEELLTRLAPWHRVLGENLLARYP